MKINYQKELEKKISKFKTRPKLLLHSCCGPCSSYVMEYLNKYFDITVYFYNPNISPETEFVKRAEEQKRLIKNMNLENKVDFILGSYNHDEFTLIAKGLEEEKEGGARCVKCYYFRLEKAAIFAKENNYDYFTTTLSISPYKDAFKLNQIGENLSVKYKIDYLFSDFKKKNGYKRSIELSKEHNLYRQDYCGCEYSRQKEKE